MATPKQRFYEYAVAFEQTYVDDDWSRLAPFFADDAVYEVRGSGVECRLQGRDAILRGLKKSIDGFDRHCTRRVEVLGTPETDGDTVSVRWQGTYDHSGAPQLVFQGRSIATVRDGLIVHLADEYDPGEADKAAAWLREHAPGLDMSYV